MTERRLPMALLALEGTKAGYQVQSEERWSVLRDRKHWFIWHKEGPCLPAWTQMSRTQMFVHVDTDV